MNDQIKRFLKQKILNVRKGILYLLFLFFLVPCSLVLIYSYSITTQYVWMGNITSTFLVTLLLIIFLVLIFLSFFEVIFTITYLIINKKFYKSSKKIDFEKIYITPNPHLTFAMKPNHLNEKSQIADYPLGKGSFLHGQYRTNDMGYLNGLDGSRNVEIPKPESLYRINCIGASTTGNYLSYKGNSFSYPLKLEEKLANILKTEIEVNNFGIGGYNSSDILISYLLNNIETEPDMIILYHAYNDIQAYLTPGLKPDYSHARKNIGESYWKFKFSNYLPNTPLSFINFILEKWFPVSPRNSLLEQVRKGEIDLNANPEKGLKIYKRNIQSIIDLCKSNNTKIILSTFCFYLYPDIANSKLHKTYQNIVSKENNIIKELAAKNNLLLIDNAQLIPHEERYFVDSIHFSPDGMKLLASNFADAISKSNII